MQTSTQVLANATFEEILDDLSSRFIVNVPEAELASVERICFQVEQAHWFYEDFVREIKPELPSFQLKTFSAKIFTHCPLLQQWAHEHERAYADFMQYRFRIPVCGAIILNETLDKCLLVKGWSSKSGWGFPKGKINQNEEYDCCAIREVLEETGYDITDGLRKNDYIELTMREQRIRLYIIVGVPEDTEFIPRTRKEISQIAWLKLDDLPTYKTNGSNNGSQNYVRLGSFRFYMVVPFVNKLKHFVQQRKKAIRRSKNNNNHQKNGKDQNQTSDEGNETPTPVSTHASLSTKPTQPQESSNALKSLLGINESLEGAPHRDVSTAQPPPLQDPATSTGPGNYPQRAINPAVAALFGSASPQPPRAQAPEIHPPSAPTPPLSVQPMPQPESLAPPNVTSHSGVHPAVLALFSSSPVPASAPPPPSSMEMAPQTESMAPTSNVAPSHPVTHPGILSLFGVSPSSSSSSPPQRQETTIVTPLAPRSSLPSGQSSTPETLRAPETASRHGSRSPVSALFDSPMSSSYQGYASPVPPSDQPQHPVSMSRSLSGNSRPGAPSAMLSGMGPSAYSSSATPVDSNPSGEEGATQNDLVRRNSLLTLLQGHSSKPSKGPAVQQTPSSMEKNPLQTLLQGGFR